MVHRDTQASKRLAGSGHLKALLVAGIAAAAFSAIAAPASASTAIYLDKGEMFNAPNVSFNNTNGSHYTAYPQVQAGPVLFTANYGVTANANTFQFLGFCVDIFDDITIHVNSPTDVNEAYQTSTLTSNNGLGSNFHAIDAATFQKIDTLITFGTFLWNHDTITDPTHNVSTTLANQLAAVQSAIWEIENPDLDVIGSSAVNSLTAAYESDAFFATHSAGELTMIIDSGGSPLHQAFAFTTSIPEPSTWALMILGFGGVGAALRRRRAQVAFA